MKYLSILILFLVGCAQSDDFYTFTPFCKATPVTGGANFSCGVDPQTFLANGPLSVQGEVGPSAPVGPQGKDVAMVQLCDTGFNPQVPTTFPVAALCVDNQLYLSYSANGELLVLLPPGHYFSRGNSGDCGFTLSAGCVVIPQ